MQAERTPWQASVRGPLAWLLIAVATAINLPLGSAEGSALHSSLAFGPSLRGGVALPQRRRRSCSGLSRPGLLLPCARGSVAPARSAGIPGLLAMSSSESARPPERGVADVRAFAEAQGIRAEFLSVARPVDAGLESLTATATAGETARPGETRSTSLHLACAAPPLSSAHRSP